MKRNSWAFSGVSTSPEKPRSGWLSRGFVRGRPMWALKPSDHLASFSPVPTTHPGLPHPRGSFCLTASASEPRTASSAPALRPSFCKMGCRLTSPPSLPTVLLRDGAQIKPSLTCRHHRWASGSVFLLRVITQSWTENGKVSSFEKVMGLLRQFKNDECISAKTEIIIVRKSAHTGRTHPLCEDAWGGEDNPEAQGGGRVRRV